jgi:hypothetical protein
MAMKAFWFGLATLAAGVQTATVRQEAASDPYILLSQDQDQQGRIKTLLRLGACEWARRDVAWMTKSCPGEDYHPDYCSAVPGLRKDLETACPERKTPPALDVGLAARLHAPRLAFFEERSLPREWRWVGRKERPEADASAHPALKDEAVVYVSPKASRMFAVSVSQDVDPRGEVSMGGYWLHLSDDSGEHWRGPFYMGFAHQYPYDVAPQSRAPAFDGDRLQLEVERREVDEKTITFPPVGLRAKNVRKDLYLSIDTAVFLKDSDGDGLTDLLEEKLLLDPQSRDTDGDGRPDGVDPLPLQASDPDPLDREAALVGLILPRVLGGDRPVQQSAAGPAEDSKMSMPYTPFAGGRVVFLTGDAALPHAAGLRAIAIPEMALATYNKKFGSTFPLSPLNVLYNKERTRAQVEYSFGWRGGTLALSFKDAHWVIDSESSWIS